MAHVLQNAGPSDSHAADRQPRKEIGRACVDYHPCVWGDRFIAASPDDMKIDTHIKLRSEELKAKVRNMLCNLHNSLLQMNLIDAIKRLGVAYHFEMEVDRALRQIYDEHINGSDVGFDLKAVALQFRLLRQQGYNVSSNVFRKFKDNDGMFKEIISSDIRGLLSLYEAAYLGTHGDEMLDEAITFATKHLQLALPNLSSPLAALVDMALDVPLHRRFERIQTRYYISSYEEETECDNMLLEFAKLDFNMLQLSHQSELRDISLWWKEMGLMEKLPFTRDRLVESYFWTLGMHFEPHYARSRNIVTKIIALIAAMDDIYDIYGTLDELELYTTILDRWDRQDMDQLPEYMKVHFARLLDVVDSFENELTQEGNSYRIHYLKEMVKELSKVYLVEARWASSGYVPSVEEYLKVASVSAVYPLICMASLIGMGDVVTKDVLEWAVHVPTFIRTSSVVGRLMDDIQSSKREQERTHVSSAIECYMKEHGTSYEESIKGLRQVIERGWKDINNECLKPTPVPTAVMNMIVNLTNVLEVIYQFRDGYSDSNVETQEKIKLVLVDPIPLSNI